MRCRTIKRANDRIHIVWFGSHGKNADGTAKFYNDNHDNFSTDAKAVADSLTQKLSVIRQELWFAVNHGLPLLEKTSSKIEMDSAVVEIVLGHEDVQEILEFESEIFQHHYSATLQVQTIYGVTEVEI